MFGLSTARAAPLAPVTFHEMITSVPGEENGASGVPWTGQVGWRTTEIVSQEFGGEVAVFDRVRAVTASSQHTSPMTRCIRSATPTRFTISASSF